MECKHVFRDWHWPGAQAARQAFQGSAWQSNGGFSALNPLVVMTVRKTLDSAPLLC
jgi:hypothetical protein